MYATPHPRINIEVADNFFTDCEDLLSRYDRTFRYFYAQKSRRLKCFNDLRAAYECILKGALAYSNEPDSDRKHLIKSVEKFSHRIADLESSIPEDIKEMLQIHPQGKLLGQLPVGLRYTLDGYDFIEAKEQLYYETVGSDTWMHELRKYIGSVSSHFGEELSKHSGLVNAADLQQQLQSPPEFNKYRK